MQGRNILHMEDTEGESRRTMIDPHVHLRDWGQSAKETVLHGMKTAASAGFTHLFDMPNTSPVCTSRDVIISRLALGGEAADATGVSYHLYAGITNDMAQVREMVFLWRELFPLVIGLKLFAGNSTGNMGIVGIDAQREVFRTLVSSGYDGVLAVHAEKEELLHPERYVPGKYETHSDARPAEAETESVRDLIMLARESGFKGTLHICHVSAASTIRLVSATRNDGLRITMGATPHHALLTQADAADSSRLLKMNPPLRSEEDRAFVFSSLLDGTIDWVESDHAPHTPEDKEKGASGIPGLPGMMLLLDRLRKNGADDELLKNLYGRNVISAFGLEIEDIRLPENPYGLYKKLSTEYFFDPFRS